jgi:hypothetical protein
MELTIKGDVQAMHLEEDDVVVISTYQSYSEAQIQRLIAIWQEATGFPNRVVVLVNGDFVVKVRRPIL